MPSDLAKKWAKVKKDNAQAIQSLGLSNELAADFDEMLEEEEEGNQNLAATAKKVKALIVADSKKVDTLMKSNDTKDAGKALNKILGQMELAAVRCTKIK